MTPELKEKMARLDAWLEACPAAVVAYSGGTDSAFLAVAAGRRLGERAVAVLADSPSLPRRHLERARALADRFGFRMEVVRTREMDRADYAANGPDRCYHCKRELFETLNERARAAGPDAVLLDVMMPKMNGKLLWETLANQRPGLPVLFISGYAADVIAEQGLHDSIQFIQKPFSMQELARKVRAILKP